MIWAVAAVEQNHAFIEACFTCVHDFLFVAAEGRESAHATDAAHEFVAPAFERGNGREPVGVLGDQFQRVLAEEGVMAGEFAGFAVIVTVA